MASPVDSLAPRYTGICGSAPDPTLRIFNYASVNLSVSLDPLGFLPINQSVPVGTEDSVLVSLGSCPWQKGRHASEEVEAHLRLRPVHSAQDIYLQIDLAQHTSDNNWVRLNTSRPHSHRAKSARRHAEHESEPDLAYVTDQLVMEEKLANVSFSSLWGLQSGPHSDSSNVDILLFDGIDTQRWMSRLPDHSKLSQLVIPGTHETLARFGYPQAKCQYESSTVAAQLAAGIRFMDVRLISKKDKASGPHSGKDDHLYAFHGKVDERITLDEVLEQVWAFLDGPGAGETLVMSIKSEADKSSVQEILERVYIGPNRHRWWLDTRVPELGEARGKIVLFSRYGSPGQPDLGIHPPVWPDNLDGLWTYQLAGGEQFATQDWFKIRNMRNVGHKWNLVQRMSETYGPQDVYAINFVSGNTSPWAYPHYVSLGWLGWKGLNYRLHDYVSGVYRDARLQKQRLDQLHNFFLLDFYNHLPELVPLLIQANFV